MRPNDRRRACWPSLPAAPYLKRRLALPEPSFASRQRLLESAQVSDTLVAAAVAVATRVGHKREGPWRVGRVPRSTAMRRIPPVHGTIGEGALRVEFVPPVQH